MEGTEEEEAFNKERATCNNFIKSEAFMFKESPRMIGTNKIVVVVNDKKYIIFFYICGTNYQIIIKLIML